MTYVVGIDEVGRGPIAGPVVVCACAVQKDVDILSLFPKGVLKDSKKITEKNRIKIFTGLGDFIDSKKVVYGIGEVSAERIDAIGISKAIQEAVDTALSVIHEKKVPQDSYIYLDGLLHAHNRFKQETIVKGDEKINEIALASIIAKVYRDTTMKSLANDFPKYGFEKHVGYGTKAHYEAISAYGITQYHRKSYLKKFEK